MHARVLVAEASGELVAFELASLRELIDAPQVQPLPLAPAALRGHLTLRGTHVPVLDASAMLGIRAGASSAGIALLFPEGFALLLDDAHDVWEQDSATQLSVPAGTDRLGLLCGLLRRDDAVASLVDTDALTQRALAMLRELPSE